uniref:Pentacotripeptide-repeat region of PRORP domain-containing protein n=1 Tax=Leersia perrieri TaxID=77586 RepID=A0A0D9VBN4_9ORYZ
MPQPPPLPRSPLAPNPAAIIHALLLKSSPSLLPPRLSLASLLAAAAASPHRRLRSVVLPALALAHRFPTAAVGPIESYALCSALRHATAAEAEPLHALAARSGWLGSVFVSCAIAAAYGGSGRCVDARRLFDESPNRNGVFGNAVLAGYVSAGKWVPLLEFARGFPELGLRVDGHTMTAVVRACGALANADLGGQAHGHAIRRVGVVESDVFLTSALVDMYAKCGLVSHAKRVFGLAQRVNAVGGDVVLWTALLNAYGRHGQCKEVIQMYDQMVASGVRPDKLAILAVLSACQHAGEVVKGLHYFESMREDYGLTPTPDHYSCVVNMLCRAGMVTKAWEIVTTEGCGGEFGISTWCGLLSACCDCGNVELGRMAAQRAIKLEPDNVTIYVELSNLYARAGLWEEIDQLREVMKNNGFEKDVGLTWVERGS